ncbi:MAG: ABC transporter permease, partial [Actinobacteria bacterium]|nr:ABC transporter permease [Actinomycetota bacterium]
MSALRLIWHQYRYDQRTFWREPAAVFFTVVLPLIFLFIFVSIFGNEPIQAGAKEIPGSTYYVPGILALAIVSATTVNLAIAMTTLRERGTLKRVRSTPLPPWVFMAARLLTALAVSVLMVVLVTLLGRIVYGVAIPTRTLP